MVVRPVLLHHEDHVIDVPDACRGVHAERVQVRAIGGGRGCAGARRQQGGGEQEGGGAEAPS